MKHIKDYQYQAVITLTPMRYHNVLRVTISPIECKKEGYNEKFNKLFEKFQDLNFSVSGHKSDSNYSGISNIIEFNIEPYINLQELTKDLEEEVAKYFPSIHNQVRIKGK